MSAGEDGIRCIAEDPDIGVRIIVADIGDIAFLAALEAVEGDLYIQRTAVSALDALGSLERVSGRLALDSNPSLVSTAGLTSLRSVGALAVGGIFADPEEGETPQRGNDSLTEIAGFTAIEAVGGIYVQNNAVLTTLGPLAEITDVCSYVVTNNPLLPHREAVAAAALDNAKSWKVCGNMDDLEDPCLPFPPT